MYTVKDYIMSMNREGGGLSRDLDDVTMTNARTEACIYVYVNVYIVH